jgi:hypothetical protein
MGIPLKVGSATADAVVAISKEISGRDVENLAIRVGKLATIDKLLLSLTLFGRGGAQIALAKSIPIRPLAVRADYWMGMGYAGASAIAAAIADGTNPVAALNPAIDFLIDIGRFNLRGAEKLVIEIASTSAFSSESVYAIIPECESEGTERILEFTTQSVASAITLENCSEMWLYELVGQTLSPFAAAAGDLVVTASRNGNKLSAEVNEVFIESAALGEFELAEATKAALVYEDRRAQKLDTVTFETSGSVQSKVNWLCIERVLDPAKAADDLARLKSEARARLVKVEQKDGAKAAALRASYGLPKSSDVR